MHAAPSPDSALALPARVASFAAEGGEVMVATDHDMVTDYAPLIRELGLAGRMSSIVGSGDHERGEDGGAPFTIGHAIAFPLPPGPLAYRGRLRSNEGRRWREVIAELRALSGERVLQLNHARTDEGRQKPRAYFSHLRLGGGRTIRRSR